MINRLAFLIFLAAIFSVGSSMSFAQGADGKSSIIPKQDDDDEDRPKSFKETMVKLRIDREKKDYDEMIGRGEEALKLSAELEKAYEHNGRLNPQEITKLAAVEKLVKKIRSELGGGDDDSDDDDKRLNLAAQTPVAQRDAIKSFRSTTVKLLEELKKTTRFTVSAAAIQASNAVLKLARMLKISR